jgi:hypothetical protein
LICCARSLASSFAQAPEEQMAYALAPKRQQFRITVENPAKVAIVLQLLQQQMGHRVLIIGGVKRILHDIGSCFCHKRYHAIASQFSNLYCLGVTKDGYPHHPARLQSDTELERYSGSDRQIVRVCL